MPWFCTKCLSYHDDGSLCPNYSLLGGIIHGWREGSRKANEEHEEFMRGLNERTDRIYQDALEVEKQKMIIRMQEESQRRLMQEAALLQQGGVVKQCMACGNMNTTNPNALYCQFCGAQL